jgi:outer membrane lipoprotein-sorting protein
MTGFIKTLAPRLRAGLAGLALLSAPAALTLLVAPAAAQQADRLDQAVAALRGISTMRADFVQTGRSGQSVKGVLTLKRPGKIRFEYEKSANLLIVGNGKSLTFIDYDVRQVERWPISNSPLGALLDPSRDVKRYGTLMPTNDPSVLSVQVHDPKKPEYGRITLIFTRAPSAPGGWRLISWVALDAQNQRTTVMLSNQRYGMAVADSTFTFRDPRPVKRPAG